MHLGNRLRLLRYNSNLKRKDITHGILSYSHYSNIELGRYVPDQDILKLLAQRMNVYEELLINHNLEDKKLHEKLLSLQHALSEFDLLGAKSLYESIKETNPLSFSTVQESWFYLLEAQYYIRTKNVPAGMDVYKNKIDPMFQGIDINTINLEIRRVLYFVQGIYYFTIRNFVQSREVFQKKLELVDTNKSLAAIHYNLALVCSRLYDFNSAISYANKALLLHYQEANWAQMAETQLLIAAIYILSKDNELSEEHLLLGLSLIEKHNLTYLKNKFLHNIGIIYKRKKMYDNALFYLSQSLEEQKDKDEIVSTFCLIVEVYIETNEIEKATSLLGEAKNHINNDKDLYRIKKESAKVLYSQGKYGEYESHMEEVINYYFEHHYWKNLEDIIDEYADYLYCSRRYKLASDYYKKGIEVYKNLEKGVRK